jgi:AcrR family transcriptional regulator
MATGANERAEGRRRAGGTVRDSSKKRARDIVDAAAEIFHSRGYTETSVHDIAEAVGILKGSLYYYIDSKEDLLFQVISDVHDGAAEIVERVQGMDGSALERLRTYVREHVAYNTRNITKIAVFYHDYRSLSEERLADIVERRGYFERFVRGLIADAQAEGTVDRKIDAKMASFALFGMMNWVYHWYRPDGPWRPEEIGDLFAELAVNGLTRADPPPRRRGSRSAG